MTIDIGHNMIQLKYAVALLTKCVDPSRDNKLFITMIIVSQLVFS